MASRSFLYPAWAKRGVENRSAVFDALLYERGLFSDKKGKIGTEYQ